MRDPATGEALKTIANASAADDDAFPAWSSTSARKRSDLLRRAFDLLQEHKEDIALLMTLEMGKPLTEARAEVASKVKAEISARVARRGTRGGGGEFLRWFSEEATRVLGRYGTNPEGTGRMIVTQHAAGPCYLITPWNFPLAMDTRKIAPALDARVRPGPLPDAAAAPPRPGHRATGPPVRRPKPVHHQKQTLANGST